MKETETPENDRREFLKAAGASLAGAVGVLAGVSAGGNITRAEVVQRIGAIRGGEPRPGRIRRRMASAALPKNTTHKELAERLKKLAESEAPTDLNPLAMCYVMFPIKREEPCPDCGRMMKIGEKDEVLSGYHVPLKRLQNLGLDVKLILPKHCPACGFGLEDCGQTGEEEARIMDGLVEIERNPEHLFSDEWKAVLDRLNAESDRLKKESKLRRLQLEIKYSDHPVPVRVALDDYSDLEHMVLFLQGKDRYGHHGEYAMKDEIGRLRELFGIQE